jgi:hypothetical protein
MPFEPSACRSGLEGRLTGQLRPRIGNPTAKPATARSPIHMHVATLHHHPAAADDSGKASPATMYKTIPSPAPAFCRHRPLGHSPDIGTYTETFESAIRCCIIDLSQPQAIFPITGPVGEVID